MFWYATKLFFQSHDDRKLCSPDGQLNYRLKFAALVRRYFTPEMRLLGTGSWKEMELGQVHNLFHSGLKIRIVADMEKLGGTFEKRFLCSLFRMVQRKFRFRRIYYFSWLLTETNQISWNQIENYRFWVNMYIGLPKNMKTSFSYYIYRVTVNSTSIRTDIRTRAGLFG